MSRFEFNFFILMSIHKFIKKRLNFQTFSYITFHDTVYLSL